MSFNRIVLFGNLGKDPELRYTPQGKALCEISVATNERRKEKSGEYRTHATWFEATLWEKQAELAAKSFKKGDPIFVEGQLSIEEWMDRENTRRFTFKIRNASFHFAGGTSGNVAGIDPLSDEDPLPRDE